MAEINGDQDIGDVLEYLSECMSQSQIERAEVRLKEVVKVIRS